MLRIFGRGLLGVSMVAMGVALMPAAGFCQTQAEAVAPAIPVEDQATPEQVERLFKVMRVREQTETQLKAMSTMMRQQISEGMKKEGDSTKISSAQQELIEKFMDRAIHMYSVDELLADMTPIYQRHVSKSDIEAFIAFFGSSSGQHFLDQQPLIVKEYMPLVMSRVQEKTKALTEEMKKEMDELDAKERAAGNGSTPQ